MVLEVVGGIALVPICLWFRCFVASRRIGCELSTAGVIVNRLRVMAEWLEACAVALDRGVTAYRDARRLLPAVRVQPLCDLPPEVLAEALLAPLLNYRGGRE